MAFYLFSVLPLPANIYYIDVLSIDWIFEKVESHLKCKVNPNLDLAKDVY